jgi:hypothetical protein
VERGVHVMPMVRMGRGRREGDGVGRGVWVGKRGRRRLTGVIRPRNQPGGWGGGGVGVG